MAKRRNPSTSTTELEAVVLGVVWRDGPCTPYAIRQEFLESPSPRWSGSAGAIYPLVRRLETRRLLRSTPGARGGRSQRDYRITPRGRTALKRWLKTPITDSDASLIHDPLRTRMFFFDALTPGEATEFIDQALEALCQSERDCAALAVDQDVFSHLAARNARIITRARVKWLTEVREQLSARAEVAST